MNNYYTCSFCGANEMDAKKIIAKGGNADPAICSECVVRCVGVLANTSTTESTRSTEMNNAASIEFWQLITALSEDGYFFSKSCSRDGRRRKRLFNSQKTVS
ncbi:ClpX C4-type zinc finger protein [Salmonella enterica subsp. enterica serovar Typhimurium]|uniref:ClpX C4-type zinc finger protein n=1 Tax=Salmonella enterica TaxID=28901 RepID=UPI0030D31394